MSQDLFLVGPSQAYPEIQDAIDALIEQQGTQPFTSTKKILVIEDGAYKAFRIPTDSLRPEPSARLEIGSANGILAVVSGNLTAASEPCSNGCLIGSNVPNVTIRRLYFRDFSKGIVCSVNCHNLIVEKCVVLSSENTGIWVYQSDNAQIINNVIFNAEFGIATTLAKNVAIVFNTCYNDSDGPSSNNACLFLELQRDRTYGIEDHGVATIFNNIFYSVAGSCIMLYERDLTNLQSDFNNIFTLSGRTARIRIELPNDEIITQDVSTLEEWRLSTNWDTVSIAEDPGFIQQDFEFGGSFIDLGMLPLSPCIAAGKLLCGDPDNDLPAYVDDALLCTDILDKARTAQPTIGANEISVQAGYYGLSVFTTTVPSEQPELVCGAAFSALDLAASQYANAVECWFPEVKSGYFYAREKSYYLYAKKAAFTLGEITRTSFWLAQPIRRTSLKISVSGDEVTDEKYWRLDGTRLHINHLDLNIDSLNDEVVIEGMFQEWNQVNKTFHDKKVTHRFRLIDGDQSYWLPSVPKDGGPIVITDDTITPLDNNSLLPMEFTTRWDDLNQETEVIPSPNMNLIQNPQFEYGVSLIDSLDELTIDTGGYTIVSNAIRKIQEDPSNRHALANDVSTKANNKKDFRLNTQFLSHALDVRSGDITHFGSELPEDFEIVTDGRIFCRNAIQVSDNRPVRPLMGRQFLVLDPGTGSSDQYVSQAVSITPDLNYYFSTYTCAPDVTGTASVEFQFLDHNNVLLSTEGPYTYEVNSTNISIGNTGEYWERIGIGLGNLGDTTPNAHTPDITQFTNDLVPLHTGAERVVVRLSTDTGYAIAYDCLQFEVGSLPTPYSRIPRGDDVTVEYEDSDKGFYTVKDLTISPVRNPQSNGFLQISPVPAGQFDTGAPYNANVLTDWFWPEGRLEHLPWAKTHGMNKWLRQSWTHTGYIGATDNEFTWDLDIPHAEEIVVIPAIPISMQDSSGDLFTVFVKDKYQNPYGFNPIKAEIFDNKAEFPGWLAHREFGIPTHLGTNITANLNAKGAATIQFIPPSAEDVEYRGDKPSILDSSITGDLPPSSRSYGFIETNYPVSLPGHGNVSLHDQFMNRITLEDTSEITGYLSPSNDSAGNTHYKLRDYPVPGTLKVFNNMTGAEGVFDRELENSIDPNLTFGQYYFDPLESRLILRGATAQNLKVIYERKLSWISPEYPRRIYIDQQALDQVTGDMIVNYDAQINLKVVAEAPIRTAGLPARYRELFIVAQNKYLGRD